MHAKMNLSTVKWAQWDKTQFREVLVCSYVCASHCAQLLHTILHRTDLIVSPPLTLQTITTAQMMSIWGKGDDMTGKFSPNSWLIIILFRGIPSSTRVRFPLSTWRRHVLPVTWRQVALPLGMCACTLSCKRLEKGLAVAEMGDYLATIHMSRKVGMLCPFPWGELGPHLTQCCLGRGTTWVDILNFSIAAICDYTIV